MEYPMVSVIMPAYNAANTISQSIESVLAQSYTNWELVITDDGSTDNTFALASAYESLDSRIKIVKNSENKGLSAARNAGIQNSKGELVAFLDSDDLWLPAKLQRQVDLHSRNKKISISHTNFTVFDNLINNKLPFRNWLIAKKNKEGILYPALCYQNTIGILTVMVKRNVLNEAGMFDTSLSSLEDRDLWVRIAKKKYAFGYIPKVLAHYRMTEGGLSGQTGKYKKAYKQFIQKTLLSEKLNEPLIWRYYYRYFGATYSKRSQYKLSHLYFMKSVKLVPFDRFTIMTLFYELYNLGKASLTLLKRKA